MLLLIRQLNENKNDSSDIISSHYALHLRYQHINMVIVVASENPFHKGKSFWNYCFSNLFICIIELEFERPGILGLTNNILKF